jgi:four helix bundle protein
VEEERRRAVVSFEDLEVFQRAYRLSLEIHRKSLEMPKIEQQALADQMRRASKSICSNLAEGYGRQKQSKAEFKRFVWMAIGSSDEMRVWARYALDLGFIDEPTWRNWRDEYQGDFEAAASSGGSFVRLSVFRRPSSVLRPR